MSCGFKPPTEKGRVLSYREFQEKSGCPWTEEQERAREALYAFEREHGRYAEDTDAWSDELHSQHDSLSDGITMADATARIAARANGWLGWPAMREYRAKRRS